MWNIVHELHVEHSIHALHVEHSIHALHVEHSIHALHVEHSIHALHSDIEKLQGLQALSGILALFKSLPLEIFQFCLIVSLFVVYLAI